MECIFCAIANKQVPAAVVFENDRIVAFRDIAPQAPVHVLIIPRAHIASLDAAGDAARDLLGEMQLIARDIARAEGCAAGGYRLVLNCGTAAGQAVAHIHYHLLAGRSLAWPPG